jgi:DNA repair exonuclease SbcCD nuclease subunit
MSKHKTLLLSDLHLDDDIRNNYRDGIFDWVEKNILIPNQVSQICIAGDLTNNKDNHSSALVNKIVTGICKWKNYVDQIYVLMGNHDGIDYNCPFFKFLNEIPNIKYINTPTEVQGSSHHPFLFLPHSKDPKEEWKGIDFTNKIVIGHVTVDGAFAENGQMLDSSVESSIFDTSAVTYSGDIHKPQVIGKLRYIGCPYNVRYGDDFEGRVLILDTHTLAEQEIKTNFLRRVTLTCTSSNDLKAKIDLLQQQGITNAQVKVHLELDYLNMSSVNSITSDCKQLIKESGFELRGWETKKSKIGAYVPQAPNQPKKYVNFDQYCLDQHIPDSIKDLGAEIIAEEMTKRLLAQQAAQLNTAGEITP